MNQASSLPTVIVGGGLTGIATALHLQRPWQLYERDERLGGLLRTEEQDGFFFDATGHWLHLRDEQMKKLVEAQTASDPLSSITRRARIYSHDAFVRYPFQGNLFGLPPSVVSECLLGFVRSWLARQQGSLAPPRNFDEYIHFHFGEGIARHFMVPYNSKLWGVPPREITSAWCGRFVPTPKLEEVIDGAVGANPPELGYNVNFVYPRHGGIETFFRALAAPLDSTNLHLGAPVEEIDAGRQLARVHGQTVGWHSLVSTMPLPELISRISDAPSEVKAAAAKLRATSLSYLNVAIRGRALGDYHWAYFPEEKYPFYRVGVYSAAEPAMAPLGCSSLYVELAARLTDVSQVKRELAIKEAIVSLVAAKVISSTKDVLFATAREIPCAYVIFDENYEKSLALIQPFLAAHRIFSCGRYGSWIYNSMEDSLIAGRDVAAQIDALA